MRGPLPPWARLSEVYDYTEAFGFKSFSFYYPAFRRITDILIDTGVMASLNKEFYMAGSDHDSTVFEENELKVLSYSDLEFGFKIWGWCCSLTFIAFIGEWIVRLYFGTTRKTRQVSEIKLQRPRVSITVPDADFEQFFDEMEIENDDMEMQRQQARRRKRPATFSVLSDWRKRGNKSFRNEHVLVVADVHRSNDDTSDESTFDEPELIGSPSVTL